MTQRIPVRIAGLGTARPARTVSTEDLLAAHPPTPRNGKVITAEWVRERTGILTRGLAGPEETVASLSTEAAGKALAAAGIAAGEVDLLVIATCSAPLSVPATAPAVAASLGATRAGALDLNAACSGFCYALALAADAVRAGSAGTAVVVGAERMADLVDPADTGTAVLFGDGAGAMVITRATPGSPDGVAAPVWGHVGERGEAIDQDPETRLLRMQGPAVFRWATTELTSVALAACAAAGVEPAELAAFVPHQANLRIIDTLARVIGLPPHVAIARDVVDAGNTSAASVPLALERLLSQTALPAGAPVLLLGFGAGLAFAGQVIRLP